MLLWLLALSLVLALVVVGLLALVSHMQPAAERQRFDDWARIYEANRQVDLLTRATLAAMRQAAREQSGQR